MVLVGVVVVTGTTVGASGVCVCNRAEENLRAPKYWGTQKRGLVCNRRWKRAFAFLDQADFLSHIASRSINSWILIVVVSFLRRLDFRSTSDVVGSKQQGTEYYLRGTVAG